jgi:hypothetical protein
MSSPRYRSAMKRGRAAVTRILTTKGAFQPYGSQWRVMLCPQDSPGFSSISATATRTRSRRVRPGGNLVLLQTGLPGTRAFGVSLEVACEDEATQMRCCTKGQCRQRPEVETCVNICLKHQRARVDPGISGISHSRPYASPPPVVDPALADHRLGPNLPIIDLAFWTSTSKSGLLASTSRALRDRLT